MAPPVLKGSCACGAIEYACQNMAADITYCHCQACRKISGGPFIPFGGFKPSEVSFSSGGVAPLEIEKVPNLKFTSLSAVADRGSCEKCSSTLFMRYHPKPDYISIAIGTMDSASGEKLKSLSIHHIFVNEKAPWYEIGADGWSQFPGMPPEFQKGLDKWLAETGNEMPK